MIMFDEIFDWTLLNGTARPIIKGVLRKWQKLLQERVSEESYHKFIHEHAGLFFGSEFNSQVMISKLRLGAEFTTDFVVAKDLRSMGIRFNLIELELPYTLPFTKKGHPSERLSIAIQQIQSWRSWLRENLTEAKRLFPTHGLRLYKNPNFSFTIVIGMRSNSEDWIDRRNDLGKQLHIDIRSFDYLTDLLRDRYFLSGLHYSSSEERGLSETRRNQLANPFHKSYTDSSWREIVRRLKHSAHFIAFNADMLLEHRTYNDLFAQFSRKHGAV